MPGVVGPVRCGDAGGCSDWQRQVYEHAAGCAVLIGLTMHTVPSDGHAANHWQQNNKRLLTVGGPLQ